MKRDELTVSDLSATAIELLFLEHQTSVHYPPHSSLTPYKQDTHILRTLFRAMVEYLHILLTIPLCRNEEIFYHVFNRLSS